MSLVSLSNCVIFMNFHMLSISNFVFTEACRKLYADLKETYFYRAMGDVLKHAPSKKGGYRFQVIIYLKRNPFNLCVK